MARDGNAHWHSVISQPAPIDQLNIYNPLNGDFWWGLPEVKDLNILKIFITNAQEWIQWIIVNVFQPKRENMCHRNVNKFESFSHSDDKLWRKRFIKKIVGGCLLKVWVFKLFQEMLKGDTEEARQLFVRKRLSSTAMLVERGWNATTTFQKVQMNGRWQQLYLSSSSGLSLFWAPSSKALKQCNWNSRRCTTVSFLGFFVPTPDEVDVQWRKFCWLSSAHGLAGRGRRGSRTVKTNVPPPL